MKTHWDDDQMREIAVIEKTLSGHPEKTTVIALYEATLKAEHESRLAAHEYNVALQHALNEVSPFKVGDRIEVQRLPSRKAIRGVVTGHWMDGFRVCVTFCAVNKDGKPSGCRCDDWDEESIRKIE